MIKHSVAERIMQSFVTNLGALLAISKQISILFLLKKFDYSACLNTQRMAVNRDKFAYRFAGSYYELPRKLSQPSLVVQNWSEYQFCYLKQNAPFFLWRIRIKIWQLHRNWSITTCSKWKKIRKTLFPNIKVIKRNRFC